MKNKILITVEGGIVQNVSTNFEAEIVIVDFDLKSDDPVIVSEKLEPDAVLGQKDKFYEEFYSKDAVAKEDQFVYEKLKELNF